MSDVVTVPPKRPDLIEHRRGGDPQPGPSVPALAKAVVGVMRQVKQVKKEGFNKDQKFEFIAMDDVLAAVQDALVANGLFCVQREINRAIVQRILFIGYEMDVYHDSGESLLGVTSHTGACRFEFKSGATDDKAANKCFSAAEKRMLLGFFKIPSEDHHTDRISDGDPDGQGSNYDPEEEERRRRLDDDRRRAPPSDRSEPPRDEPGAPPPRQPEDVFPEAGGRANPPPTDAASDFNGRVSEFHRKLKAASTEGDARLIWSDHFDLIRQMQDNTYNWLFDGYHDRWGANPPRA